MADDTPYERIIEEAQRMYVEDGMSEGELAEIIDDAMRHREELQSPGDDWQQFAADHNMNVVNLLPRHDNAAIWA